jgi:hypothetical protein
VFNSDTTERLAFRDRNPLVRAILRLKVESGVHSNSVAFEAKRCVEYSRRLASAPLRYKYRIHAVIPLAVGGCR